VAAAALMTTTTRAIEDTRDAPSVELRRRSARIAARREDSGDARKPEPAGLCSQRRHVECWRLTSNGRSIGLLRSRVHLASPALGPEALA
jgi:hypothetical protein